MVGSCTAAFGTVNGDGAKLKGGGGGTAGTPKLEPPDAGAEPTPEVNDATKPAA